MSYSPTYCGLCGVRTTVLYPCARHGRLAPVTRGQVVTPAWRDRIDYPATMGVSERFRHSGARDLTHELRVQS